MKSTVYLSDKVQDLHYKPFGEDGLTLVFCLQGRLCVRMDEGEYELQENDLLRYINTTHIGGVEYSDDCEVMIYIIRLHSLDSAFYHCLRTVGDWWGKWNFIMGHPIIHLDERQRRIGQHFHELITFYTEDENYDYREEALDNLKQMFVYEVLMWIKKTASAEEPEHERLLSRDALIMQFMRLVETNGQRQREVQWYAEQMHISPKYLSDVVKQVTGKTAISVIRECTIREIENQLLHTDKSVKEIAYEMNFVSLSAFSKYVRQYMGDGPAKLRDKKAK